MTIAWIEYASKHLDKGDDYDLECEVKDIKEVMAEISRLQAENDRLLAKEKSWTEDIAKVDELYAENARLREALDKIGAMFYIAEYGACLLKPDYGNYDVLGIANVALAEQPQEGK